MTSVLPSSLSSFSSKGSFRVNAVVTPKGIEGNSQGRVDLSVSVPVCEFQEGSTERSR